MSNTLQDALRVGRFLWPRFGVREGAILALDFAGTGSSPAGEFPSLTEAEILLNHVHVLDQFENSAELDREPWYDTSHPDFRAACQLGILASECWAAKLRLDFPKQRFKVFYTQDDNPVVRFHQVRDGERAFLDEEDWAAEIREGRIVVRVVG